MAAADMVISHVETLIERLTGVSKAIPDNDGDYPLRYHSVRYYVRVPPSHIPIVQVFSVAVDKIRLTDSLARDLNALNTQLAFCRTFWVQNQILFETEHLAATLTEAAFNECAFNVAYATDGFASELVSRHGGTLAFESSKEPGYRSPPVGPYL